MKFIFSLFSFFLLMLFTNAQEIKFNKLMHDFGSITEGEKATYVFSFKNTGNKPLILTEVKPSCGCTSPSWPKTPIMPGDSSEITVIYNSSGRPGSFYKTIAVKSNATEQLTLRIKGIVYKQPTVTTYTEEEKKNSPTITSNKLIHNFGKIEKGTSNKYSFIITNTGKSHLIIKGVQSGCSCVNHTIDKESIEPGMSATLILNYVPRLQHDNTETVIIQSNDVNNPTFSIQLKAEVVSTLTSPNMLQENQNSGF